MRLFGLKQFIAGAKPWRSNALPTRQQKRARKLLVESLESRRVFAAFSPGNLLVLQAVGDTATGVASEVSLVEYTTSGTFVQAIPVTSTGANSLTLRASSTTEGALSISSDGQVVTFGGYRADAGSANPSTAAVDRVIGRVDAGGVVNTLQAFSDGFTGDSLRSVATDDGSRFWISGAGTGNTGSVRYMANTTNNTTTALTPAGGNTRQVQVINGQLYVSSGSSPNPGRSVFQVGAGLPTSGAQTFSNSIPVSASGPQYQSFYFADLNSTIGWNGSALDTLFTTDTNTAGSPVTKWSFDGGAWVSNGTVGLTGLANIVGITSGSTVTLYGTTSTTGTGAIKTLTDSAGFNGAFAGTWADLATPVVSGGSTAFRGITRVPQVAQTQLSIAATDASKLEGDAGLTTFTFTVTRTGPVGGASSANWAVTGSGVNPAAASDFGGGVFPSGTVNFLAGEVSKAITVNVNGDLTNEPSEGFTVTLATPVDSILGQATAAGSILNDDAATDLSISATSANKAEGNVGSTSFTFTVTRTGVTAGVTSTATYTVSGSGATQATSSDFQGGTFSTGTVTFNPGQTSQVISIPVSGDTAVESDEGFTVTLSDPSAGTSIIGLSANGVIVNDDSSIAISPATVSAAEGNSGSTPMVFTVTRTGDTTQASNVEWSVAGSGTSPASADDFVGGAFPTGTVNFLANESIKTITVNIQGDTALEGFDLYSITLNSATVGTIATSASTGIIVADDFQSFSPGDIVITAISSDNPDSFSFVPLISLLPGSPIVFTDNAWSESNTLLSNEGSLVYLAPAGGLAAGTKVIIEYDSTTPAINFLAGSGTASISGNFGLSTDGDSLMAYVGIAASPTFLFAATTWGEYLTTGTPTTNQTYLPPSLSVGSTAVGALGIAPPSVNEVDNAQYNHAAGTSGTPAQIRALVANRGNWTTDDLPISLDATNFSVIASTVAPKVETVTFGDGTSQRSMVQRIRVNFDSIVTMASGAFALEQGGSGGFAAIPAADLAISVSTSVVSGKTIADLSFSSTSSFIQGGSLPDGNYRMTILSNLVTASGVQLDGDNNGTAGGNYVKGAVEVDAFFRRFGDSNGNRTTTLAELGQLRAAINKASPDPGYDPRFDFNNNGTVTLSELGQLRSRINARLDF